PEEGKKDDLPFWIRPPVVGKLVGKQREFRILLAQRGEVARVAGDLRELRDKRRDESALATPRVFAKGLPRKLLDLEVLEPTPPREACGSHRTTHLALRNRDHETLVHV